MKKPLKIFVSHPLFSEGTPEENIKKAEAICQEILADGNLPISPLHFFCFMKEETPEQRQAILDFCKHAIADCDLLFSYGNKGGCKMEKEWAQELKVPVMKK